MARKPLLQRPEKLVYNKEEAAQLLGVRSHVFANFKKSLGLEYIHSDVAGFNKQDLSFWREIIDLKNQGLTMEGIKKRLEEQKKVKRQNKETITQLKFLKTWLMKIKEELES